LKTVYTVEDAYLMWEVIAVDRHNQWLAAEEARKNP
jgi:hypothetical protein